MVLQALPILVCRYDALLFFYRKEIRLGSAILVTSIYPFCLSWNVLNNGASWFKDNLEYYEVDLKDVSPFLDPSKVFK